MSSRFFHRGRLVSRSGVGRRTEPAGPRSDHAAALLTKRLFDALACASLPVGGRAAGGRMDGIDLTDLDLFASGFPHELFQALRREAPVWWHPPTEHTPDGE